MEGKRIKREEGKKERERGKNEGKEKIKFFFSKYCSG